MAITAQALLVVSRVVAGVRVLGLLLGWLDELAPLRRRRGGNARDAEQQDRGGAAVNDAAVHVR